MSKPITEDDLRMPEFRGVNLDEYEWDDTGENIVRKDRWEMCVRSNAHHLGISGREFTVQLVRDTVENLMSALTTEERDDLDTRLIKFEEVAAWVTPTQIMFIHKGQVLVHPPEENGYRVAGRNYFVNNIDPNSWVLKV